MAVLLPFQAVGQLIAASDERNLAWLSKQDGSIGNVDARSANA